MEYSFFLLVVSCLASSATAFTTVTSSLQASGRSYACPGEQVTFTCVTDGTILTWTIPPFVNESSAATFHISDNPGQAILLMPQAIRLLIGTSPNMSSQMTVTLSDNFSESTTVKCRSNDDQVKTLPYGLSAPPQPPLSIQHSIIDQHQHQNGSLSVTINLEWARDDNPDISFYLLQVSYNNGSKIAEHRTTDNRDSVVVELQSQEEKNVTVEVFTVNKCNQSSTSSAQKNITIQPIPAVGPTGGSKPKRTMSCRFSDGEIVAIAIGSCVSGGLVCAIASLAIYRKICFFKKRRNLTSEKVMKKIKPLTDKLVSQGGDHDSRPLTDTSTVTTDQESVFSQAQPVSCAVAKVIEAKPDGSVTLEVTYHPTIIKKQAIIFINNLKAKKDKAKKDKPDAQYTLNKETGDSKVVLKTTVT